MNKEKLLLLLNEACKKLSESYDYSDNSTYIDYMQSIEGDINKTIKIASSNIVMPKVFDEFHKSFKDIGTAYEFLRLSLLNCGEDTENEIEDNFRIWLMLKTQKDDKAYFDCVDAIVNGYEVEK